MDFLNNRFILRAVPLLVIQLSLSAIEARSVALGLWAVVARCSRQCISPVTSRRGSCAGAGRIFVSSGF